ncbi:MAG: hypothetical protein ACYTGP_07920 [Planctomycetota bacterium]
MNDRAPSPRGLLARNLAAAILTGLGIMQLTGYVFGLRAVRGIAACTAASPLPKVFSDADGLETFASRFTLVYELGGVTVRETMTPELYQQLRGPYWRRNVYGAALAYGPRMPEELWEPVFCYGIGPGGPFHRELDVPAGAEGIHVVIETKTRGRDDVFTLEPRCAE